MTLDIDLEADSEWDSSIDWLRLARAAATSAMRESAFPQLAEAQRPIELSVRLSGDDEVRSLNAHWRGKDRPTNVLSFPMAESYELEQSDQDGPGIMLGDVVLAHGVCAAEAAEKQVSLVDHAAHLIVHGTLHLLGYDHQDERDAAEMERREVKALAAMGIADPYEDGR